MFIMKKNKIFSLPKYRVFLANGQVIEQDSISLVFDCLYSKQTYGFEVCNFNFYNNGDVVKSNVLRFIIGKVISRQEAIELLQKTQNVNVVNFIPVYQAEEFFYNEALRLLVTKTDGAYEINLSDGDKFNGGFKISTEPKFSFIAEDGKKIAVNNFTNLIKAPKNKYIGFRVEYIDYSKIQQSGKPVAKYQGAKRFFWGKLINAQTKEQYAKAHPEYSELKPMPDAQIRYYAINEEHKVIVPLEENCFVLAFKEWPMFK